MDKSYCLSCFRDSACPEAVSEETHRAVPSVEAEELPPWVTEVPSVEVEQEERRKKTHESSRKKERKSNTKGERKKHIYKYIQTPDPPFLAAPYYIIYL